MKRHVQLQIDNNWLVNTFPLLQYIITIPDERRFKCIPFITSNWPTIMILHILNSYTLSCLQPRYEAAVINPSKAYQLNLNSRKPWQRVSFIAMVNIYVQRSSNTFWFWISDCSSCFIFHLTLWAYLNSQFSVFLLKKAMRIPLMLMRWLAYSDYKTAC